MYRIKLPVIILNLKTYLEATGDRAVNLAKKCEETADKTGIEVAVAPQFTDIANVTKAVSIPVLAQHIDPYEAGKYTGHILAEAIRSSGAIGTLLNHSERKLPLDMLEACVKAGKKADLFTVTCADTPETCRAVANLKPNLIAIEPPELIGTGIPVSKAKPEIVTEAVKMVNDVDINIPVLCGAGITSGSDVKAALRLGTKGILLASGVVKAQDPLSILMDMANAISTFNPSS
jgi:triosephosphate isomerase